MRAHGCGLTGKMSGGGLRSVAWASVITLDSTSVITLELTAYSTGSLLVQAQKRLHLQPEWHLRPAFAQHNALFLR